MTSEILTIETGMILTIEILGWLGHINIRLLSIPKSIEALDHPLL